MKSYVILLVVGGLAAASKDKVTIDESSYPEDWVLYRAQHDIVRVLLPLNAHKRPDDAAPAGRAPVSPIFFVEADTSPDGRHYRGLYIMRTDKPQKLLENGRDAAAPGDRNNLVYLAASDGVYTYDEATGATQKYGSLDEDVIGIEKQVHGEPLYILTAAGEVYNVTDAGHTKKRVEGIEGAEQICLDYEGNLFFSRGNRVHVRARDGEVKEVSLPGNPPSVTLVRPTISVSAGVLCAADELLELRPDGSTRPYNAAFKQNCRPTALSVESGVLQYYGRDKKIYENSMLATMKTHPGGFNEVFKDVLAERVEKQEKTE